MKRKIEKIIAKWKNTKDHKPLLIVGARQIGKTYSVVKFANENYKNVIYINFVKDVKLKTVFDGNLDVDNIIMMLSASISNSKFIPGVTVIIFDEIQLCPNARTALKFFAVDGRFDVISTGSLLGLSNYINEVAHIPVGYESIIDMHSLDFEEFLWANGVNQEIKEILNTSLEKKSKVPVVIHDKMMELLKQYIVVGGMPEAINTFVNTHDIEAVYMIQQSILREYKADMIKYSSQGDKAKIIDCFLSIPRQLAKENKKFQYKVIENRGSKRKYAGSINWLKDAGVVIECRNISNVGLPLEGNTNDSFKLYMQDIGLLTCMLERGSQFDILSGNLGIYKGAIYENLIADIFNKMNRKLYYFSKSSGLEIDFVIRYKGKSCLVEVKSENGNAKSLKTMIEYKDKYFVQLAIKLANANIGLNNGYITLPLYMAYLLESI